MTSDGPTMYSLLILRGLQDKPQYQGTVPAAEKARRRAAGKVAKQQRKRNRSKA